MGEKKRTPIDAAMSLSHGELDYIKRFATKFGYGELPRDITSTSRDSLLTPLGNRLLGEYDSVEDKAFLYGGRFDGTTTAADSSGTLSHELAHRLLRGTIFDRSENTVEYSNGLLRSILYGQDITDLKKAGYGRGEPYEENDILRSALLRFFQVKTLGGIGR